MCKDELKSRWRLRWVASIEEFADLETQRRKWLDPDEPSPHYSFVEYMCCYFDDLQITRDEGGYSRLVADGIVSTDEVKAVADFHKLADEYDPPEGEDFEGIRVLNDPAWLRVVAAARAAQEQLLPLLTDSEERTLLLGNATHDRQAHDGTATGHD